MNRRMNPYDSIQFGYECGCVVVVRALNGPVDVPYRESCLVDLVRGVGILEGDEHSVRALDQWTE